MKHRNRSNIHTTSNANRSTNTKTGNSSTTRTSTTRGMTNTSSKKVTSFLPASHRTKRSLDNNNDNDDTITPHHDDLDPLIRSITKSSRGGGGGGGGIIGRKYVNVGILENKEEEQQQDDTYNYALLIALYTLQGIPMGLSASIPFLIQQKIKEMTAAVAASASASSVVNAAASVASQASSSSSSSSSTISTAAMTKMAYNAQAIFALCSWPFSLKLLWAPIVDSIFWKKVGRRKSWLVPVQLLAGSLMISGSDYIEQQLGLGTTNHGDSSSIIHNKNQSGDIVKNVAALATNVISAPETLNIKGVTIFFFILYFLMATQDIAVDGWALTMLSKKNRGRGPVCNSIGQNLGYFLSFVGFLALNDVESSEKLWRPLLGLESNPNRGMVSLGAFIRFMGYIMVCITTFVAFFKKEVDNFVVASDNTINNSPIDSFKGAIKSSPFVKKKDKIDDGEDDDAELDASQIGLRETYSRLWAVCCLKPVQWLFVILLTNRFATALSDKVKFLKAVEFGLSKQTTALLAPTIILPLGILVPIVAAKVYKGAPLRQFLTAYKLRVTLVPILDVCMLLAIRSLKDRSDMSSFTLFWSAIIASTAVFSIVESMQFNAQMVFFAQRVDPAIGGTYMTLLNTAANLGGTWPAPMIMWLVGQYTIPPKCEIDSTTGMDVCIGGRDAYFPLQIMLSIFGCIWIYLMSAKVRHLENLPADAWRTHLGEDEDSDSDLVDMEKNTRRVRKDNKSE